MLEDLPDRAARDQATNNRQRFSEMISMSFSTSADSVSPVVCERIYIQPFNDTLHRFSDLSPSDFSIF